MLSVIIYIISIVTGIADVKRDETPLMTPAQAAEAKSIGEKLARLRLARRIRQADAAARAGLSRSTAALIEKGDPGRQPQGNAGPGPGYVPGLTLLALLQEEDPSLRALAARETTQRARPLSPAELKDLDF